MYPAGAQIEPTAMSAANVKDQALTLVILKGEEGIAKLGSSRVS
jgi:hypothetical protein